MAVGDVLRVTVQYGGYDVHSGIEFKLCSNDSCVFVLVVYTNSLAQLGFASFNITAHAPFYISSHFGVIERVSIVC